MKKKITLVVAAASALVLPLASAQAEFPVSSKNLNTELTRQEREVARTDPASTRNASFVRKSGKYRSSSPSRVQRELNLSVNPQ